MKSAKRSVSCAAFLGLMLMISGTANAEYDSIGSYNSSFGSDLSKADSLLRPAGTALGGNVAGGNDALEAGLKASLEKIGATVKRSEEEFELRKKVEGGKVKAEGRQKSILAIKKADLDKVNAIVKANDQDLARINSLNQAPGGTGADLQAPKEISCKSGVDFEKSKSLTDTMGSQPVQHIKDEMSKLTEEKNKAVKTDRLAKVAKLFDSLEKFKAQNKEAEQFQQPIQQRQDIRGAADSSGAKGLALLKAEWDNQKTKQLPDLDNELTKLVKESALNAVNLENNATDPEFVKLKAFIADNFRAHARGVKTSFRQGGDTLLANCEANVDIVGRDTVLGANTWSNRAYQFASKISPRFANDTLLPMLNDMAKPENTTCTDVSSNIETLFGAPMEQAIAVVQSSRDPKALISNAFAMVNAIANAQSQIGTAMKPLIDDCDRIARNAKKVKDYVGQVKSQSEQVAAANANGGGAPGQPGQPNRNRANPNSVAAGGRPNHNPAAQPGRNI